MISSILQTKLYFPALGPNLVRRPHLLRHLKHGVQIGHKLSLISAPAGYGKTTLISEWLHDKKGEVIWLSLDPDDNDLSRFMRYFIAALQRIEPHYGASLEGLLHTPQLPPASAFLPPLINDLAASEDAFIIVLDDYHLIDHSSIHDAIAYLLDHAPQALHLVLITREDPPLPIPRWRARGQLTDIRKADLAFNREETARFFEIMLGLELTAEQITGLEARAEGWAAGLHLAALSMSTMNSLEERHDFLSAFTNSQRYILDYLADEVLGQRPKGTKDFLLKTAVLERMCAPLCEAVTGQKEARKILFRLERANLFIVSLDEAGYWFRYHHLFADLLRHRLNLADLDVAQLHRRAGDWYETNDLLADAIHHALAAQDWGRAAPLLLRISGTMLISGQITMFLAWMQRLPKEILLGQAALCLVYGWALARTEQLREAAEYFDQAEAGSKDIPFLYGRVVVGKAHVARALGQIQSAIELSEKALALLPDDDLEQRSIAGLNLGIAYWSIAELPAAEEALITAYRAGQQSGTITVTITALCFRARVQALHGYLRAASESYRQAIILAEEGKRSPSVALAYADLASLHYEWNHLDQALAFAKEALHFSQLSGDLRVQIITLRVLSQIWQALGRVDKAKAALLRLHEISEALPDSDPAYFENAAYQVEFALAAGLTLTQSHWVEKIAAAPLTGTPSLRPRLVQARFLLIRGEKTTLKDLLDGLETALYKTERRMELISLRLLQALAAPEPRLARTLLMEAVELSQPEGLVRSFVDLGDPIEELLRRLIAENLEAGPSKAYVMTLLSAFDRARHDRESDRAVDAPQAHSVVLPDPPSQRELEVLRLLASGLSNREIADALFISVNTVRTHLRRIYVKLDVNNRLAAVSRAQQLRLL